jgi:hypothetical protein
VTDFKSCCGSLTWTQTAGPFAITIFTPDVVCPALTVKFGAEADQWQGSRSPGVASAQAIYWPGARPSAWKEPLASAATIATNGPVITGGAGEGGTTEGARLISTRAPGTGWPLSSRTEPR